MALNVSHPGIFSKIVIVSIVISLLMFGTPVAALPISNSYSGYYHGMSYGYSVNLQSTSTHPVIGTSESQGISVVFLSPVLAGPGYRGNYLPANPGSTQALFKKLKYDYSLNSQKFIPVPPDYIQLFSSSENIHIATSIDYVDTSNQHIHSES